MYCFGHNFISALHSVNKIIIMFNKVCMSENDTAYRVGKNITITQATHLYNYINQMTV